MPTALRRSTTWASPSTGASHEDYQDSYPAQRLPLDCGCGLYLGDTTAWPTSHPPAN